MRLSTGKLRGLDRDIVWGMAFQRAMRRLDVAALGILVDLPPSSADVIHRQRFDAQQRLWQGAVWFDSHSCAASALVGMAHHTSTEKHKLLDLMRRYTEWKFDGIGSLLDFEEQELVELFPDVPFLAVYARAGRLEAQGLDKSARELLMDAASAMPPDQRFRPAVWRRAMRLGSNDSARGKR